MSLNLDFSNDYLIWDNPEKIVYVSTKRKAASLSVRIEKAIRHRQEVVEAGPTGGAMQNRTCKWFLPGKLLAFPSDTLLRAKPGDRIRIESASRPLDSWLVLKVNYEELDGVYELDCTLLTVNRDLANYINVSSPLNRKDTALGRRILWTPKYSNVRCKIQETQTAIISKEDRQLTKHSYLIYVEPGTTLDLTDEEQVVDRDTGDIYDVEGWTNPQMLTEPQVIQVMRTP